MDLQVFCRTQLVVGKRFWFFLCFILFFRFWHLHHKAILCLLVSGSSLEDVSIVFGLLYLSLLSKSYLSLWEPVPEQYLAWVITVLVYNLQVCPNLVLHGDDLMLHVFFCRLEHRLITDDSSCLLAAIMVEIATLLCNRFSFACVLLFFGSGISPVASREWKIERGKESTFDNCQNQ